MFWTVEKLQARIHEIKSCRYREALIIKPLRLKGDPAGTIGTYPSEDGEWEAVRVGHRWQGRDEYRWLAADGHIPETWGGRTVVGLFDFGQTGGGTNSGFESLLFLDGSPFQGVRLVGIFVKRRYNFMTKAAPHMDAA